MTTPFKARLRIAPHYTAEIMLRTFTGDLFVLLEVLCDQPYLIPEAALPRSRVRVILDCGANVGITALYFAARYAEAQIYSIEPDAKNFSLLSRNTQYEPRITAIRAAVVGEPRATVRLTTDNQAWGNKIAESAEGEDIPATTIQQICERHGLSQIDLLKMDIEGAEREVFHHGSFLDRVTFVIAELHDNYTEGDFETDMAAHRLVAAPGGSISGISMTTASRDTRDLRKM